MRIVALEAIAYRRRMHLARNLAGVLIVVAGDAKLGWRAGGQLDAGYVFSRPNLVTSGTAHSHRGMDRLALGLVLMAFQALRGVRLRIQGHRMGSSVRRHNKNPESQNNSGYGQSWNSLHFGSPGMFIAFHAPQICRAMTSVT